MPSYTYKGPEIEIVLRGVHFPQGEAIEIEDSEFQKKLDNLPFFDSDKPKEVVKPAAVADSEKDAEISRLQRENGRLTHQVQALQKQLAKYESEPEPTPVEVAPEEEVITEYTPSSEDDEDLEIPHPGASKDEPIPDDWREWHWKRQMVLAKKFMPEGTEIANQADAIAAIELELERRGG